MKGRISARTRSGHKGLPYPGSPPGVGPGGESSSSAASVAADDDQVAAVPSGGGCAGQGADGQSQAVAGSQQAQHHRQVKIRGRLDSCQVQGQGKKVLEAKAAWDSYEGRPWRWLNKLTALSSM